MIQLSDVRALLDDDFTAEYAFRAQVKSAAAAGWDDAAPYIFNDLQSQHP